MPKNKNTKPSDRSYVKECAAPAGVIMAATILENRPPSFYKDIKCVTDVGEGKDFYSFNQFESQHEAQLVHNSLNKLEYCRAISLIAATIHENPQVFWHLFKDKEKDDFIRAIGNDKDLVESMEYLISWTFRTSPMRDKSILMSLLHWMYAKPPLTQWYDTPNKDSRYCTTAALFYKDLYDLARKNGANEADVDFLYALSSRENFSDNDYLAKRLPLLNQKFQQINAEIRKYTDFGMDFGTLRTDIDNQILQAMIPHIVTLIEQHCSKIEIEELVKKHFPHFSRVFEAGAATADDPYVKRWDPRDENLAEKMISSLHPGSIVYLYRGQDTFEVFKQGGHVITFGCIPSENGNMRYFVFDSVFGMRLFKSPQCAVKELQSRMGCGPVIFTASPQIALDILPRLSPLVHVLRDSAKNNRMPTCEEVKNYEGIPYVEPDFPNMAKSKLIDVILNPKELVEACLIEQQAQAIDAAHANIVQNSDSSAVTTSEATKQTQAIDAAHANIVQNSDSSAVTTSEATKKTQAIDATHANIVRNSDSSDVTTSEEKVVAEETIVLPTVETPTMELREFFKKVLLALYALIACFCASVFCWIKCCARQNKATEEQQPETEIADTDTQAKQGDSEKSLDI